MTAIAFTLFFLAMALNGTDQIGTLLALGAGVIFLWKGWA